MTDMQDKNGNLFINLAITILVIGAIADIVMEVLYPKEYSYQYFILIALLFTSLIKAMQIYQRRVQENFEEEMRKLNDMQSDFWQTMQNLANHAATSSNFIPTKEEVLFEITTPLSVNQKYLKNKYRELSKKYHPDLGGSEEEMKTINTAYEKLKLKYA